MLKGAALDRFLLRKQGKHWDGVPVPHVEVTDLDEKSLERFRSLALNSKQETFSENKIYPYATLAHLREDLIAKARKVAGIQRKDHPWLSMDDQELLQSAQLYQTNLETGKSGVTLASCRKTVVCPRFFRV